MQLIDIYNPYLCDFWMAVEFLFQLLKEREPHQSISHKKMPSLEEHVGFVKSKPYRAWYLAYVDNDFVGATYLSKQREIGVSIFKEHQRKGYAEAAIRELMRRHPGEFLANVNPANAASIALFKKLGGIHIQNTYRLGAK